MLPASMPLVPPTPVATIMPDPHPIPRLGTDTMTTQYTPTNASKAHIADRRARPKIGQKPLSP